MADFDPRNPKIICRYGIAPISAEFVEGSTQSFDAGEFVDVDASGAITVSATGASTGICGIALEAASGTASTALRVQVVDANDEVIMLITDASGSGAAHTNCVPGVDYDLLVSSNIHSVNYADVTNPAFLFVSGINDSTGTATNYGRFKILASVTQMDGVVS
jgi:hypothetical protein